MSTEALKRLASHGLRAVFITEAYGVRDEQIMAHSRHRVLRTMCDYI